MKKERVVYFDYLRVAATIAVVVIHVAAQNWNKLNSRSFEWNVLNVYDSIVRWGVPIFVMISGALLLSKEIGVKDLYFKKILRLIIAYCVWSSFYAVVTVGIRIRSNPDYEISNISLIAEMIGGNYHMWFIPMIVGIYICIPIIKQIVGSRKTTSYYLVISFIFAYLIPQCINMINDFIGGLIAFGINQINGVISEMDVQLVLGFTFYFILGYLLDEIELTKKQRRVIYGLGIIGFGATILISAVISWKMKVPCETYYDNFNVNILLEAIAIHTWFKYRKYDNDKLNAIVSMLSKYSFGAYLVHAFLIDVL